MQRRDFFKSVTAGAAGLLASRGIAAVGTEQRFGDLLVRQPATDHYELLFTPTRPRPLRLLHLADTHFHPGDETNRATEQVLRAIVAKEQPDFIVHTGDFVNNDSKKPVDWVGMDVMNGLNVPWTLCFGNHDYPVNGAEGSLPLRCHPAEDGTRFSRIYRRCRGASLLLSLRSADGRRLRASGLPVLLSGGLCGRHAADLGCPTQLV